MCEQYAGFFKTFSNAGHPIAKSPVFDAKHGRGVAIVRAVGHFIKIRCVIFYCNCAPWKNESPSKIGRGSPLDQENFNLIMMRVVPNEEHRRRWSGRTRHSSFVRRFVPDAREIVHHIYCVIQSLAIHQKSRNLKFRFDFAKQTRVNYSKKMAY